MDRKRRRAYLVKRHGYKRKASASGKAGSRLVVHLNCSWCGLPMRAAGRGWHVGRWPICGHLGGRYVQWNIVPSCPSCNESRCSQCAGAKRAAMAPRWERDGWDVERERGWEGEEAGRS